MSLRKMVYAAVTGITGFEIPDDQVFSSGAVGHKKPGDSPSRPFAVVRFNPDNPGLVSRYPLHQRRFSVWLHDEPGSMDKIETAVAQLKLELPPSLPGVLEGLRVIDCVWEGTSADGYDDHFGTNTVYVDFMATYRPAD
jgi:hypothetical protein